jgi:hypothetical protein
MSKLAERQQQLMDYVLGHNEAIAEHVIETGEASKALRLHIYRNNYNAGLREAIDTDFEMLGTYLGDDLFEQMVRGYIKAYPSHCYSLKYFGDHLPVFLRENEPFKQHPQLAELARFERLLLRAFDASESQRALPQALQQLEPSLWPELRLAFHPSVQIFKAEINVVEIWQALKGNNTPPDVVFQPFVWVLWRNHDRLTEFRSIDAFEQLMLEAFLQGVNLADVAEQLLAYQQNADPTQPMVQCLLDWLEHGWVNRLRSKEDKPTLRSL